MDIMTIIIAVVLLASVIIAALFGEWKSPTYLVWLAIALILFTGAKLTVG